MMTMLKALSTARRYGGALVLCFAVAGCAGFDPKPHDEIGFEARAVTKTEDGVTISAVALGPEEAKAAFGVPTMA